MVGRSNDPVDIYRLDVAHDDYPYETSWSLQSFMIGNVVTPSGLKEVTESG